MAIRVVSSGTTIVKSITVGTPIKIGDPSSGALKDLDDVNKSGLSSINNYLRWDSASQTFLFQNFDSDVKNLLQSGTGITYDVDTGTIEITESGVVAGAYGSATQIPTFNVTETGQIDSIGLVSVAGVSGLTYTDSNANLTLSTADGGSFEVTLGLDAFSTDSLAEGTTNLYYTTARADSDLDARLVGGTGITVSAGDISITNTGVDSGTYGSSTRIPIFTVNPQGQIDSIGSTSVASVSDLTFDSSNATLFLNTSDGSTFNTRLGLAAFTTDDLTEGSNLYYTDSRGRAAFSLALDSDLFSYDSPTGVLTIQDSKIARTDYMDTFDEGLRIPDGKKIIFCDEAADIFENNGNLFIRRNNTAESDGNIYISAKDDNSIFFNNRSGDRFIAHFHDGEAVDLFYNNQLRFSTTDSGGKVEGNLIVSNALTLGGAATILGDLTVQGTTTTINSTTLSVDDKNLVLAADASDSSPANGAGITVNGANAIIEYNSITDTWDLNKPLGNTRNHLVNFSTQNLSEHVSNLYYTSARVHDELSAGTGLTYNDSGEFSITNTGVTAASYGSASQVPVLAINAQGQVTSASTVSVAGVSTFTFDSASATLNIGTADGGSFNSRIGLSAFDTDDLAEGTNLYYTDARARSAVSASGDLVYDDSTGVFSINVAEIYTQADFDSDFNVAIDAAALDGTGLTYASGDNTLSIDSGEFTAMFTTSDLREGSNLYFTEARVDSAIADQVETVSIGVQSQRWKDSTSTTLTQVLNTYVAADGRDATVFQSQDASYAIGMNTNNFVIENLAGQRQLRTYGDSGHIELYFQDSHRLETTYYGVNIFGKLHADSIATDKLTVSGDIISTGNLSGNLFTGDVDRSASTNVDSGTYGTSTLIPVITVDRNGFIDSIGTTTVAGVSTLTFDSSEATLNIGTADGGSFNARIGISSFSTSDLSEGTNLYYTTARADSAIDVRVTQAFVNNLDVDADTVDGIHAATILQTTSGGTVTGGNLTLNDNIELRVGTGADLKVFHDASDTFIKNVTGGMYLQGDLVTIQNSGGTKSLANFVDSAEVTLYYNNVERLRTSDSGSTISGNLTVTDNLSATDGTLSGALTANSAVITTSLTVDEITNTSGVVNTAPTQTSVSSDVITVVDTTSHGSDFTSIEYTVHMDDSDLGQSQISKLLLTYDKSNVFYTEYGMISSFSGDSDIGTLTADVSGADIRLKFQRATGMGTVNVKPVKAIIK